MDVLTDEMRARVFAPLAVGNTTWRNRIFVPAHTTNYGSHHLPSERHLEYHRARARGGAAAIIFEGIRVHPNCLGRPQGVGGYDPACIDPFRRIADAVRAEGAKMLGQVIHLGRQIDGDYERTVSWGPSAIPWAATAAVPHAIGRAEMDEVIAGHLATACNLLRAGFDGLEIQLAHGHLLQQFLSPLSNTRDDEFGGSEENRLRFPLALLRAVRAEIGADACMGIRLGAEEFVDGGLHVDEVSRQLERILAEVGVDFINVSHSAYHGSYSLATQMADMQFGPTPFRGLPRAIRDTVHRAGYAIPVFAVCRFVSLTEAAAALIAGEADAVGMARAHLADPAIVNKSREGRADEVKPCIGCNQGCSMMLEKSIPITCIANPRAGREGEWPEPEDDRAETPRDVVVVGGGPAGLEAAWVAAARGHRVRLIERAAEPGGQLNWLERMPHRAEFLRLRDFQLAQCCRFQVNIQTDSSLDSGAIAAMGADVVVVATGSRPRPVTLPDGVLAMTMEDALAEPERLGKVVAIYDQIGEWSSVALVEHIAPKVERLVVFSPVAGFGWRTTIYSGFATRKRLREKHVRLALLQRVIGFNGGVLRVEDTSTGDVAAWPGFDSLVATQYNVVEDSLQAELQERGVTMVSIGDCLAPRTAMEAVFDGHRAARAI